MFIGGQFLARGPLCLAPLARNDCTRFKDLKGLTVCFTVSHLLDDKELTFIGEIFILKSKGPPEKVYSDAYQKMDL